jgi:hypothetical protein
MIGNSEGTTRLLEPWRIRNNMSIKKKFPHRWCLHFIVVVRFECSWDPESYAGGILAIGRGTHAGQVKG